MHPAPTVDVDPDGCPELTAGCPEVTAAILEVVHQRVGVDFRQYRPATVERRIRNRMLTVRIDSPESYLRLLMASGDEAAHLAERLTIKVSRFYRNHATFDLLRHDVVRALAAGARQGPVRIWCAGCGCGEEAYTLAMLLADAGVDGVVEATDVDAFALDAAARGTYDQAAIAELPADLAGRFLEAVPSRSGTAFRVCDAVRARVRFSRHDLTSAAPPSDLVGACDLVTCRNVLIYLQPEPRSHALQHVLAALAGEGVLVLGEAEWLPPTLEASFDVLGHKARVFRALPGTCGGRR
jgi:chemotaxis methyl-accepting protein methylase